MGREGQKMRTNARFNILLTPKLVAVPCNLNKWVDQHETVLLVL